MQNFMPKRKLSKGPSSKGSKKSQKKATPKPAGMPAQAGQPPRETAAQDIYPTNWDEAEKWILSKCELHKGATVSANIAAFITRLDSLIQSGGICPVNNDTSASPTKPEVTESKSESTRISPRLSRPQPDDIKTEDPEFDQPLKRARGRPRKSITAPETQQLLTNYFQVQPDPSSPTLNENFFNPS